MVSSIYKSSSPVLGVGTTVEAAELNLVDDFTIGGHVTMADAKDFVLNASTGTKIGTAITQKVGFYNSAPVAQLAHADQVTVTDSTSGGVTDTTIVAISGSGDDTDINDNFAKITQLVNRLRADLVSLGLIKGAA